MKKVAVITRTKDRPVFLKRAIKSVTSQSFKDYVHVIVNDGGDKDDLQSIVDSFDKTISDNIKVFHRKNSSNAPDTIFNESIDRVSSEYFAIHDDDDTWHADFLKQTVQHLDENKELGAVVVRADKVDETVEGDWIKEDKRSQWMPSIKAVNLYRQCIDNQFTPITSLFRRSAYEAVGKFDTTLPVIGDWEFGVRLLQKYDADFIDPGYALANYHHRKDNDNISSHEKHRYYTNKVMNKYLRDELADGRIGVGYIMSQLKYKQSNTAVMVEKFLPSFLVNSLKKRAQK